MTGKKMQALSSRIPPVWAATVSSDLYKSHACLRKQFYTMCDTKYKVKNLIY